MGMELGKKGLRSDINVTPLVDVMLVLLIIFMVITPMLQRGQAVQLPQVAKPEKQSDDGQDLIVSVVYPPQGTGFGVHLFLGEKQVDEAGLKSRLADELRKDSSREIYLKGDKRLHYGAIREIMEICHEAGFGSVKLATEEISEAPH